MVAIEKALAPPPEGSTATKTCCVFLVGSRSEYGIAGAARLVKASMEEEWKACAPRCTDVEVASVYVASGRITFSEPSAEMPRDSRRSIAGSSARSCLTTSTF